LSESATVEDLHDVTKSALGVVHDIELDSAMARTSDRGSFYRTQPRNTWRACRAAATPSVSSPATSPTTLVVPRAAVAATDALVEELHNDLQLAGEAGRLQHGLAVVREVVDLARPVTNLIDVHANAALVASREGTSSTGPTKTSASSTPSSVTPTPPPGRQETWRSEWRTPPPRLNEHLAHMPNPPASRGPEGACHLTSAGDRP
jgi:hypothetical protein